MYRRRFSFFDIKLFNEIERYKKEIAELKEEIKMLRKKLKEVK